MDPDLEFEDSNGNGYYTRTIICRCDITKLAGSSFDQRPAGLVKDLKAHSLTYCLLPSFNRILGYSTLSDG